MEHKGLTPRTSEITYSLSQLKGENQIRVFVFPSKDISPNTGLLHLTIVSRVQELSL